MLECKILIHMNDIIFWLNFLSKADAASVRSLGKQPALYYGVVDRVVPSTPLTITDCSLCDDKLKSAKEQSKCKWVQANFIKITLIDL